jgi:hypothetical protein
MIRLAILLTTSWVIANWLSYSNQTWYGDGVKLGEIWFPNIQTLSYVDKNMTVEEVLKIQTEIEHNKAQEKYRKMQK